MNAQVSNLIKLLSKHLTIPGHSELAVTYLQAVISFSLFYSIPAGFSFLLSQDHRALLTGHSRGRLARAEQEEGGGAGPRPDALAFLRNNCSPPTGA